MNEVEQLLRDGHARYAIVEKLLPKMARATIDRYIAKVYERWKAEALLSADRESVVHQRLERLKHLARKWEKSGNAAACARIEGMINDIYGVSSPVQHELRGAVAHGVVQAAVEPVAPPAPTSRVDVRKLSDDVIAELERVIGEQLALPAQGTSG